MSVYRYDDTKGAWALTRWRSLRAVKSWATRYGHVYEMRNDILIVSTAEGWVHRYSLDYVERAMEARR